MRSVIDLCTLYAEVHRTIVRLLAEVDAGSRSQGVRIKERCPRLEEVADRLSRGGVGPSSGLGAVVPA
jgi:hypothetical protein